MDRNAVNTEPKIMVTQPKTCSRCMFFDGLNTRVELPVRCVSCGAGMTNFKARGVLPAPHPYSAKSQSALDTQVAGTHYKDMKIQPVEFIHANGLGFLEGCIVKRICRWKNKNGVEDLRKIIHEVNLLIELEERNAAK